MILILVVRLETVTGRLNNQPLCSVWVGFQMPPLTAIWQLYLPRFAIEHWYREYETNLALDCTEVEYP